MSKLLFCLFIVASSRAWANARAQGWCEQGGHPVVVSANTNSISTVQISYPQCTVRVFLTGTQTLATLFSDNNNTSLGNPFTADVFGHWFFYAANGRYDVQISGAGLAAPYTFGDIFLSDATGGGGGGGSGTVNPGTGGQITYYAATGNTVSGATVVGAIKAGSPPTQAACADLAVPCITENQTITLSGDTTGSGKTSIITTTGKVNGISYSATAPAHSIEVITTANTTATAKVIPDCQDSGGNHLNYTQSSDTISCGTTSSGGGGGGSSLPFATTITSITQVSVAGSGAFGCNGVNNLVGGGSATIVPLAGTASEQLDIGISCADLRLKLIAPSNTFTCTAGPFAGCDTITGGAFTDGIIPLSEVTMSTDGAGSFTFTAVTDLRAPFQDDPPTAGVGIIYTKSGSTRAIAVDTTQVPLLATVNTYVNQATPGTPPASGSTKVYPKAGSGLCALDSSSVERCSGGGSGTVNSGTTGELAFYPSAGTTLSGSPCVLTTAAWGLDVNCSGTDGTIRAWNQGSGYTQWLVRQGTAQGSFPLTSYRNNADVELGGATVNGEAYIVDGSLNTEAGFLHNNGVSVNVNDNYVFGNTVNAFSGTDLMLSRNAAGIMEINSGVRGTLRDLTLRNITVNGTCTGCPGSGTVNSGTAGQTTYYAATGTAVSGATVTGAIKAGNPPTQAACADLSNGAGGCSMSTTAGGDLSGTLPSPTVSRVNGIAYSATAAAHSVEVVTTANTTATAKVIPDCQDSAGNHLNYTQSSDTFGCGTSSSGGGVAHSITFVMDGQGAVPTTGDLNKFPIAEFACTINRVDVTADQSGSMTMDIWKRASRAIPSSANKISASDPATLSSAQISSDATLTGWTTSVSVGDVFGATLVTATTITSATVQIWCQ